MLLEINIFSPLLTNIPTFHLYTWFQILILLQLSPIYLSSSPYSVCPHTSIVTEVQHIFIRRGLLPAVQLLIIQCNGQAERYNGIIMKTILLALDIYELLIKYWERVLPDVLHSICSLISTSEYVLISVSLLYWTIHSKLAFRTRKFFLKKYVRHSKYLFNI